MTKTDNSAEVGMHVFERAGLGKAPFRCIGFAEVVYQAHPDAPRQPGGSCDYCGTGIMLQCKIKSADGRVFKVGSDCVAKTDDAGLIRSFKTRPEVRAMARDRAKAKDAAICAEWVTLIEAPAAVEKLSAIMVPGRPWIAGEQVSLLDSMKRLWGMCGAAGRARTLKTLKVHLKGDQP
jgi:hypothetical protein